MNKKNLVNGLIQFLADSPTQYHATRNMVDTLKADGFRELNESEPWRLKKNGKYYVIRGDGALIAFKNGATPVDKACPRIVGTHTDSPSLKIKSSPDIRFKNYLTLGVEVYGGALLSTWFDRDLSIAGRVAFVGKDDRLQSTLIDFSRPVAVVPNLAIHLSQNPNENTKIDRQKELPPVFAQFSKFDASTTFKAILKKEIKKHKPRLVIKDILDFDLSFYDTQQPNLLGYHGEFLTGGRIDNLLSCYTGLRSMLETESEGLMVLVCNDHEEIGSGSRVGAAGPFFEAILNRLVPDNESYYRTVAKSILLSVDNAHGVHPNYSSQSDKNHAPLLNGGPAIKVNANQRYATNSETGALFRHICYKNKIPVQTFINHTNLGCGSTIGPITSTRLGINTIDIGVPTFAMHSIRETCGTEDIWYLFQSMKRFYLSG